MVDYILLGLYFIQPIYPFSLGQFQYASMANGLLVAWFCETETPTYQSSHGVLSIHEHYKDLLESLPCPPTGSGLPAVFAYLNTG